MDGLPKSGHGAFHVAHKWILSSSWMNSTIIVGRNAMSIFVDENHTHGVSSDDDAGIVPMES